FLCVFVFFCVLCCGVFFVGVFGGGVGCWFGCWFLWVVLVFGGVFVLWVGGVVVVCVVFGFVVGCWGGVGFGGVGVVG
ncbi:hypothetical protein, partial [Klebsiella pneumoniae]|uniref:hypothetical protein n=1 Tax=Klebsiella pneumoniae TaxID=573 RepID=UPI001C3D844F